MTAVRTLKSTLPAERTGAAHPRRSRLARIMRRLALMAADAIDGAQLGPGPNVEISRHTGGRI